MAADWEAYNLFSSIDKVVGTQRQVQLGWLCAVTDDFQTKPALGFQELVDMRPETDVGAEPGRPARRSDYFSLIQLLL